MGNKVVYGIRENGDLVRYSESGGWENVMLGEMRVNVNETWGRVFWELKQKSLYTLLMFDNRSGEGKAVKEDAASHNESLVLARLADLIGRITALEKQAADMEELHKGILRAREIPHFDDRREEKCTSEFECKVDSDSDDDEEWDWVERETGAHTCGCCAGGECEFDYADANEEDFEDDDEDYDCPYEQEDCHYYDCDECDRKTNIFNEFLDVVAKALMVEEDKLAGRTEAEQVGEDDWGRRLYDEYSFLATVDWGENDRLEDDELYDLEEKIFRLAKTTLGASLRKDLKWFRDVVIEDVEVQELSDFTNQYLITVCASVPGGKNYNAFAARGFLRNEFEEPLKENIVRFVREIIGERL